MAGAIAFLLTQHGGLSLSITLPLGFVITAAIDMLMEKMNQAGAELPDPSNETGGNSASTPSTNGSADEKARKSGKKKK